MTGQQLLHELRCDLELTLDTLAQHNEPEREPRIRYLEDRSLWSGRLRRVA